MSKSGKWSIAWLPIIAVACGGVPEDTNVGTEEVATPPASAVLSLDGAPEVAASASLYRIQSGAGRPDLLALGVRVNPDSYLGVGVELPAMDGGETVTSVEARVFLERNGVTVEGVCAVSVSLDSVHARVESSRCDSSDGTELAFVIDRPGIVASVGMEEVASALPEFSRYSEQALAHLNQGQARASAPSAPEDSEFGRVEQALCECAGPSSCDANLTNCLLLSFSCGPFYALCAVGCMDQYNTCRYWWYHSLQSCGC